MLTVRRDILSAWIVSREFVEAERESSLRNGERKQNGVRDRPRLLGFTHVCLLYLSTQITQENSRF